MSQTAYVEQSDRTTFLTAAALKERGWTDALIRDLLGPPDASKMNPHYRSGPPMRLYDLSRVEAVEASGLWADRAEATRRRKEAAARAVETKRAKLLRHSASVEITVPNLEQAELTQLACKHYNQRLYDRGDFESWEATTASDPTFLYRISVNFLRHALSDYDAELGDIIGAVGVREGYRKISSKAYAAIGAAYPTLVGEYQRQLEWKFDKL